MKVYTVRTGRRIAAARPHWAGPETGATAHQLDRAISQLVDSIGSTVRRTQTGLAADAVDTVFFTGGSSGVPLLRQRIAALLPAARRMEGDPFGSIGSGLALAAARRF